MHSIHVAIIVYMLLYSNHILSNIIIIIGAARLIRRVWDQLMPARPKQHYILPDVMVLCTLHFMGSCAFQRDLSDLFGVSQSSVSRIVAKTAPVLARLSEEWIGLPEGDDIRKQHNLFFEKGGIPGKL
eukprot:GHVO01043602.1.p1 GENE.GHVO01043602.1~~GHVO01043602.1.p1  ORF type:complete len:128 (-),score=5.05 GHVO01043602.1:471-854(-)